MPAPLSPPLGDTAPPHRVPAFARVLYLVLLLYGFLVAIQLMSGSFKLMGSGATDLLAGVSNPFAGLAVGVLATVLVQSSSTTTSVIVALVGGGTLDLQYAVPMVMGANIGTTVTNTLVSIGHVRRSEEFRRAFAAATVHDFFNVLNVLIFLPLEIFTGFLSKTAQWLTSSIGLGGGGKLHSPVKDAIKGAYKGVLGLLEHLGAAGVPLAVIALILGIALTFLCLHQITRNMRLLVAGRMEQALNDALARSGLVGIVIGALTTVAVQSSSITTSLLVPMCGAGILTLPNAFPIMLGANLGTTVTALLASLAADLPAGLTIALVHVLFNLCGVAIFYPFRALRAIPMRLAEGLAAKSIENRLWVLAYVLGVFVVFPLGGWVVFG